jgi:hypothetical protein
VGPPTPKLRCGADHPTAPVTPVRRLVAITRCAHRSGSFAVTAPDDADANAIFCGQSRVLYAERARYSSGQDAGARYPKFTQFRLGCVPGTDQAPLEHETAFVLMEADFFLAGLWDLAILRSKADHNHKDEDVASSARCTRNQR